MAQTGGFSVRITGRFAIAASVITSQNKVFYNNKVDECRDEVPVEKINFDLVNILTILWYCFTK